MFIQSAHFSLRNEKIFISVGKKKDKRPFRRQYDSEMVYTQIPRYRRQAWHLSVDQRTAVTLEWQNWLLPQTKVAKLVRLIFKCRSTSMTRLRCNKNLSCMYITSKNCINQTNYTNSFNLTPFKWPLDALHMYYQELTRVNWWDCELGTKPYRDFINSIDMNETES